MLAGLDPRSPDTAGWLPYQLNCPSVPSVDVSGPLTLDQNCSSVRTGDTASSLRSCAVKSFLTNVRPA
jgi:hypothetical protein